jgi:kanamycin kinase
VTASAGDPDRAQTHAPLEVPVEVVVPGNAPGAGFTVPEQLTRLLGHGIEAVVWVNQAGGVTVRGRLDGESVYAKWAPAAAVDELGLAAEAERLEWARRYLTVPQVVDLVSGPDGQRRITRALPGRSAVAPRWLARPERAVIALGEGLRALHETLPASACPFSWSIADRISRTLADGRPERVAALDALGRPPSVDRLVVCHADACAPNTLLSDDGAVAGHVDLGRLGTGDRWADIAVGAWSTVWNYGEGFEHLYYQAYGVDPDEERIAYYRALWDAS